MPITEPGTYLIRSWGRKCYVHDVGANEYDGGICATAPEAVTLAGDCMAGATHGS
jgi:hypothetical protein